MKALILKDAESNLDLPSSQPFLYYKHLQAQTGNNNISAQPLLQTVTCRAHRERNTQNQPSILTTTEAVGVVDEQVLDVGDGFVLSVEHRHAAAAVGVLLPVQ